MLTLCTVLAAAALTPAPPPDQVVVAAEPSLDAQRLADALAVYLGEFGIRVEPREGTGAPDLRKRLEEERALGEAVRAIAVVRVGRAAGGAVEIELVDLATDKALLMRVPRPARDEDLYRALALKIQAVLRSTLSEARADLAPGSSLARLVGEGDAGASKGGGASAGLRASGRVAMDVGFGVFAFPLDGPSFAGLAARLSWRPVPRWELALATAALRSHEAETADPTSAVSATATIVPLRVAAKVPLAFAAGRIEVLLGPCVEATYLHVAAASATTAVRSARNIMVGLGGEVEGRLAVFPGAWLFARAAALGVLNGERYSASGVALVDTSRLQLSAMVGAGVGLP